MKRRRHPNLTLWRYIAQQYIGRPVVVNYEAIEPGIGGVADLDGDGNPRITVSPVAGNPVWVLLHEIGHHVAGHPQRSFAAQRWSESILSDADPMHRDAIVEIFDKQEDEANEFAWHAWGVLQQVSDFEEAFWLD